MLLNMNRHQATFGSPMPNRSFSASSYKYGFNGKEKDDEIKGGGNSYDFGERLYDARLGKWLSLDPLMKKYQGISPYNYTFNNPIIFNDPDGRDGRLTVDHAKHQITLETTVFIYGGDNAVDNQNMAAEYNTQFQSMNNTKLVKGDKPGEVWTVKINVTFVAANMSDNQKAAMGPSDSDVNTSTTESIPNKETFGFQAGDNMLKVNTGIKFGGRTEGQTGLGFNEGAVASKDPRVGIHEVFHMLGFIDRYDTQTGLEVGPYVGDVVSNGDKNTILDFHYVDLMNFALSSQVTGTKAFGEKTDVAPSKTEYKNGVKTETLSNVTKSSTMAIDAGADIKSSSQQKSDVGKGKKLTATPISKPLNK